MKKHLMILLVVFMTTVGLSEALSDLDLKNYNGDTVLISMTTLKSSTDLLAYNGMVYNISAYSDLKNISKEKFFSVGTESLRILKKDAVIEKKLASVKTIGYLAVSVKELETFNGKSSSVPAFFASDGKIYDVTENIKCRGGVHTVAYQPGKDITIDLKKSKHSNNVIKGLLLIGILTFNFEDLYAMNGKNGKPSLVGVNGKIYDFSELKRWAGGEHLNVHSAGQELTYQLKSKSPHGVKKITSASVIGLLATDMKGFSTVISTNKNLKYSTKEQNIYEEKEIIGFLTK